MVCVGGEAAVESAGETGFIVKSELVLATPPAQAYARFIEIGKWWSDDHTYSGSAANMTIQAQPGGCFCETLPNGGFVQHAAVVYAAPGKGIRLNGAIGPLLVYGGSTSMSVAFEPNGQGTKLTVTLTGIGYEPQKGLTVLAPAYDAVLAEQFGRFKRYVETGKPKA
jgi:hypothetical protein